MTVMVIPVADVVSDAQDLLYALLFSIESQNIQSKFTVVVCYDGCKDSFVNFFQNRFPWTEAVINRGNRLNFAGNSNNGLRLAVARGQGALVVNQDCILPAQPYVDSIRGAGVCVASPVKVCPEPPIVAGDLLSLNFGQPTTIERTPHKKLIGFCMYLSKELLEKVGVFDEVYKASFEDDDICARALLAGFPVEHVNVNVHHYGSRCGAYDLERLWKNSITFRAKWSIPISVEHANFNEWIVANHTWSPEMYER